MERRRVQRYYVQNNNDRRRCIVKVSADDAINILVPTPTFDDWHEEEIPKHQQQSIYKLYKEHLSNDKELEITLDNGQTFVISKDSIMIPNYLTGAITFANVYYKGKFNGLQDGGKLKLKFTPISNFAMRETLLLGKRHPNLEITHHVCRAKFDENTLVVVSSWCDVSLTGAIEHFPPDMSVHQKVLRNVLEGIKYMHSNHITLRNISINNVCLDPEDPVLDETTRFSYLKEGKFNAKLTDFAAIKPNLKIMIRQKSEESGFDITSDEEESEQLPISAELYHVENPTQEDYENFDLKCFIKFGINMYRESGKAPGEVADLQVALKDFNDLILNEKNRPITIELLSKHLLLMTDKESHDLVYNTVLALGFKGWKEKYYAYDVQRIEKAGKYLLEKTSYKDWRNCFKTPIVYIKPGFKNQFPFRGKSYRHFMSFAHILYSQHANCEKLKSVLDTHYKLTMRPLDTPERITKFLIRNVPRLRKFCVLVQNISNYAD